MARPLTSGSGGSASERGRQRVLLEHLPPGSTPLDPPQPRGQGPQGDLCSGLAARRSTLRHQVPPGHAVFSHPVGSSRVLAATPHHSSPALQYKYPGAQIPSWQPGPKDIPGPPKGARQLCPPEQKATLKSKGLRRSEGRGLEIYIWDSCNCHWGGLPHRATP